MHSRESCFSHKDIKKDRFGHLIRGMLVEREQIVLTGRGYIEKRFGG